MTLTDRALNHITGHLIYASECCLRILDELDYHEGYDIQQDAMSILQALERSQREIRTDVYKGIAGDYPTSHPLSKRRNKK